MRCNEELGTNDPLIEQFGRLVKGVVTFDYGDSYAQTEPVSEVIGERVLAVDRSCSRTRSCSRSR